MIYTYISWGLLALFALVNVYQILYLFIPFLIKKKPLPPAKTTRHLGVLVAARNEAAVLGHLLDSIHAQDYPADKVTVCVVADNCTDDTAAVAESKGALVTRRHSSQVGKGYALSHLLCWLKKEGRTFDAYLVLDADNLLAPGFLEAINRGLERYPIVTGYRHTKNFGDSWISACCSLWFLRMSQFYNRSRYLLGTSCTVSGTGFAFRQGVVEDWPYYLLTEDVEFSADRILAGQQVGYCEQAVLYDEQPVTFAQNWRQRLRWAKGNIQVVFRYAGRLFAGACRGSFACYDVLCSSLPAFVFSVLALALKLVQAVDLLVHGQSVAVLFDGALPGLALGYGTMLLMGLIPLVGEWRRVSAPAWQKVLYLLTFPLFMAINVPIALQALFCRVEWKPIIHTKALRVEELV